MGWDDIYDPETFDDMLLLLAIPGISIGVTIIVVAGKAIIRRHWVTKHPDEAAELEAAAEAAEDPLEKAEDHANRIRFGLQQSIVESGQLGELKPMA